MNRSAGIVVFSRITSTRLPGKALRDFGGMPLLAWVIRRAKALPYPVFLATSVKPSDDPLVELAERESVPVYRGPLDDVLGRAAGAVRAFGLDVFVRLCGDRPYFDLEEMRHAIGRALADPAIDLVSNWLPGRTAPGLMTEVIRREAIERADRAAKEPDEREHVTSWFYANPNLVKIERFASRAHDLPGRFAVDTAEDLAALRPAAHWGPEVSLAVVLADRPTPLGEVGG